MHTGLSPKIAATRRAQLECDCTRDGGFDAGTIIEGMSRPEHSSRKIHSTDGRRTILFEVIDHGTHLSQEARSLLAVESAQDANPDDLVNPFWRPRLRPLTCDAPSCIPDLLAFGAIGTPPGSLSAYVVAEF
jgi:hypothetical protein